MAEIQARKILFPRWFSPNHAHTLIAEHDPKTTHPPRYDFERSHLKLIGLDPADITGAELLVSLSDQGFSSSEIALIFNSTMPANSSVSLITPGHVTSKSSSLGHALKPSAGRTEFFWWRKGVVQRGSGRKANKLKPEPK